MKCAACGKLIAPWHDRHSTSEGTFHMRCSFGEPPPPETLQDAQQQPVSRWTPWRPRGHFAEREE